MNPFNVYAVRRAATQDWIFERTVFLPNGQVSNDQVRLHNMTHAQARAAKLEYVDIDVMLGPLYSARELGMD